ncbi:ATP-binding protein [Tuberibacillus calidus]|uniref:ATP-binding protein n=1 Tax=Tuberibacillus calidus TaxID=340097 RepID=UPI00041A3FB4|nr:ATP-binding protein [Tuberibacillus calidus]
MFGSSLKIGKLVKIENLTILVEITERDIVNSISLKSGINDFVVSINKFIYAVLPNSKKIIARISKIYDRNLFINDNIFTDTQGKFLVEAELVGIYDDYLKKFDTGINTFPIIGSELYSINQEIYSSVLKIDSEYLLDLGKSYNDPNLSLFANPDILLGKHLGVFGNTGTGKSCTIASILQGIKRRLKDKSGRNIEVNPKIIIFDSNNEYERAFPTNEFRVKVVKKDELKLPHYYLSFTEYYKFLGASQGVQAPVLKAVIEKLRQDNGNTDSFAFADLHDGIVKHIETMTNNNAYNFNQWFGWNATLINRIDRIVEDERIFPLIETDQNTVEEILTCEEEIIIIQADFDKDEFDIVMFLFSKLLYKWSLNNRVSSSRKNILVLFEEAHRYINEEENADYKLGNYYIERLAREGRKFGISLIISSQRPSELSKTVLSQCNSYIVHRITNKNDLEFINKLLSKSNTNLLKLIPGLERQYAVVIGEAFGYSDIIKIETASPTPLSDDPKVINNWKKEI